LVNASENPQKKKLSSSFQNFENLTMSKEMKESTFLVDFEKKSLKKMKHQFQTFKNNKLKKTKNLKNVQTKSFHDNFVKAKQRNKKICLFFVTESFEENLFDFVASFASYTCIACCA
jgi:hypothetical protein